MSWNKGILHGGGFGELPSGVPSNYVNSDESILGDANRPRDSYGFRIKPGHQLDKFDWRDANKNRYLDYCVIQGGVETTGVAPANWSTPDTIPLYFDNTGKFTVTGSYTSPDPNMSPTDYWESISKGEVIGNLGWKEKDGRIVIPTSGNYMVQYYTEYNWVTGTTTTYSTAPKLYTAITYYNDKGELEGYLDVKTGWGVLNPDLNEGLSIQMLDKGYSIGLICYNGRNSVKAFCRGCVKLLKLS